MVTLVKVNGKNVWDVIKLHVSESQEEYVASNTISIIDAYVASISNGHAFPFAIYDNETLVGFLMVGFDVDDAWENPPEIAHGNYNFWRLMIDERYQKHGIGRQAIQQALDFIKSMPCGCADYCWLSYEPENDIARKLYASFGFVETGDKDEGEIIAVLKL